MPSHAYNDHLVALLADVEELLRAHERLRTKKPGRQWRIGALNRSVVVMSLSCWEQYVESLAIELVDLQRPVTPAGTAWPALRTSVTDSAKALNTPSPHKVRTLISKACGLADVTTSWAWQNTTPARAITRLEQLVSLRGDIAHGVNPRPIVHNGHASSLPAFVRSLASATDRAVADHVAATLHLPRPW